jgi:capsular exopolysaccharide synthesis family protein
MSESANNEPSDLPQRYLRPGGSTALQRYQPAFEPEPGETAAFEHYLQVLGRRKWLLLAVALTVLLVAALQVFTTTPLYKATAVVQIDPENPNILPYEEVEGSRALLGKEEYLWTQAKKLQTRELARRVVEKSKLADNPLFTEPTRRGILLDVVGDVASAASGLFGSAASASTDERVLTSRFQQLLEVRPLRNTRLIEVSFESPDSELAALVANTVAEEFIEQHLESKFDATTRATQFLGKQLEELQLRVERSEQELLRYAKERNIVNLGDRETIARKRLEDFSDELTRAKGELIAQQARHETVRTVDLRDLPESLKTPPIRELETRISQKDGELAGLADRYGPEWPTVKTLRSELAELRQQLETAKRQALGGVRQEYELVQRRYAELDAASGEQRSLVDKLNEDSIQYNILKRESDSNKELYQGLLQRLKEASVSAGLRSSNVRVVDPARPPRLAASPRKARALALALILGLLVGTGIAFLVEALDNTVKTADDVWEQLGLPALGVVPHFQLAGAGKSRSRRVEAPILVSPECAVVGKNRVLEAYRSLRTSLLLSHSGTPPQTILVTSALPGEGKTTTAVNIAMALAQTGARTLLVDLDLRKPGLAGIFGIAAEQGMSTYLSGNSDLSSQIRPTRYDGLFVVPAGLVAPNPAELIGAERMALGLQLATEHFAYVVFDTPPALAITDALILSPKVDGVILVARSGRTPRKALQRAASQVLAVGGKLLGVLINDVDLDETGYGYGGYHGYYGKYLDAAAGEESS